MYRFDETAKGTMENINDMTMRFMLDISSYLQDEKTLYDLRLIVTELMVNGVRHGNMDNFNKLIRLCAVLSDDKVTIKVKDQGKGIKNHNCKCSDFTKTNGRGLFIVEHIADRIIYNNNEVVVELQI